MSSSSVHSAHPPTNQPITFSVPFAGPHASPSPPSPFPHYVIPHTPAIFPLSSAASPQLVAASAAQIHQPTPVHHPSFHGVPQGAPSMSSPLPSVTTPSSIASSYYSDHGQPLFTHATWPTGPPPSSSAAALSVAASAHSASSPTSPSADDGDPRAFPKRKKPKNGEKVQRKVACMMCHTAKTVCMPESDTRVLTDAGFLFLSDIEARIAAKQSVLYACYEPGTESLVYCRGRVVLAPPPERWVDFTQAATRRRWTAASDQGRTTSEEDDANHLTLRTTPEHLMYVQPAADDRAPPEKSACGAPRKMAAVELAPGFACSCEEERAVCAHGHPCYRMYTAAASGVAASMHAMSVGDTAAGSPGVALGLRTRDELSAFLQLYGYWLAVGYMSNHIKALSFNAKKQSDRAVLLSLLARLRLQRDREWHASSTLGSLEVHITAPHWFKYFDEQYGRNHVTSARFFDWVLTRLDKDQLRLLLEGMCQGSDDTASTASTERQASSPVERKQVVCTSAVPFREELMQACMHAGYSAYFTRSAHAGKVRGHRTEPADSRVCSEAEMEDALLTHPGMRLRPLSSHHDQWCVHYSESNSELLRAEDVRYDGGALLLREDKGSQMHGWVDEHSDRPATALSDAYDERHDGRVWCVEVDHADHLIFAQRAHTVDGVVIKVGRAVAVGNCIGGRPCQRCKRLNKIDQCVDRVTTLKKKDGKGDGDDDRGDADTDPDALSEKEKEGGGRASTVASTPSPPFGSVPHPTGLDASVDEWTKVMPSLFASTFFSSMINPERAYPSVSVDTATRTSVHVISHFNESMPQPFFVSLLREMGYRPIFSPPADVKKEGGGSGSSHDSKAAGSEADNGGGSESRDKRTLWRSTHPHLPDIILPLQRRFNFSGSPINPLKEVTLTTRLPALIIGRGELPLPLPVHTPPSSSSFPGAGSPSFPPPYRPLMNDIDLPMNVQVNVEFEYVFGYTQQELKILFIHHGRRALDRLTAGTDQRVGLLSVKSAVDGLTELAETVTITNKYGNQIRAMEHRKVTLDEIAWFKNVVFTWIPFSK